MASYPGDSVIQPLNNWDQDCTKQPLQLESGKKHSKSFKIILPTCRAG